MSILETPRILFRGNMSWDPIVTNNQDDYYDEALCESELPGGTVMNPSAASTRQRVLQFRKKAIAGPFWNQHGTHRSSFYDLAAPDQSCPDSLIVASEVSGVDLGGGPGVDDPFVGAPAQFTGMLVDVEPYGSTSSQLFFDTLSFGIPGGCRILARRRTRATARYLNFGRNRVGIIAGIASIIWQTSFLTEDLTIDAFDSPALAALEAALGEPGVIGLSVRWSTYRTFYYDTPLANDQIDIKAWRQQQLVRKLSLDDPYGNEVWQPNPARSKLVGSIGLWREGEPLHEPGDRALVTQSGVPATAFARVDADRVTVDLVNSVPETGFALEKRALGDLDLQVQKDGGWQTIATLAESDYDRRAYESNSGVVSKPIEPGSVPDGAPLRLCQGAAVLLAEQPIRVIPVVPNVYVDEGETATISFQIYLNGEPEQAGVETLKVARLDANYNPLDSQTATPTAGGLVTVDVETSVPGVCLYVPLVGGETVDANSFDPQVYPYVNVRCLPVDESVGALPPTWDNVYSRVLANWNAMAPCMDNWLDLNDPQQILAYRDVLLRLTDRANFESFRYMPVTRDMTVGQRKLLAAFLGAADGSRPAALTAPARERPETGADSRPRALSRAMRSS